MLFLSSNLCCFFLILSTIVFIFFNEHYWSEEIGYVYEQKDGKIFFIIYFYFNIEREGS